MTGRTRMGLPESGRRWVDMRFRSAFLLVSRDVGKVGVAGRVEAFDTRNSGSWWGSEYDDSGWAATLAGKRQWAHVTGLVELIHVSSRNGARSALGLETRQSQTRLQADVRLSW